jgi:hypothetical protein
MDEHANVQPRRFRWIIAALLLGLAYGLITRLLFGIAPLEDYLRTLSFGFMCVAPAGVGALAVFIASRGLHLTAWAALQVAALSSLILMIAVIVFNVEIALCIVMASPLYVLVAGVGGIIMNALLNRNRQHPVVPASILLVMLAAPYLVTPVELRSVLPDLFRTVNTSIYIEAAPETVWENIIRVAPITEAEQSPSLYQLIGIPRPLHATLTGDGLGAVRRGIFEYGIRFEERITLWVVNRAVAFDIRLDPLYPVPAPLNQIGGQFFAINSAAYEIEPDGAGGVTLHLSSSYRLTTGINAYAALWADGIMADFQNYVLRVVKARAERTLE